MRKIVVKATHIKTRTDTQNTNVLSKFILRIAFLTSVWKYINKKSQSRWGTRMLRVHIYIIYYSYINVWCVRMKEKKRAREREREWEWERERDREKEQERACARERERWGLTASASSCQPFWWYFYFLFIFIALQKYCNIYKCFAKENPVRIYASDRRQRSTFY